MSDIEYDTFRQDEQPVKGDALDRALAERDAALAEVKRLRSLIHDECSDPHMRDAISKVHRVAHWLDSELNESMKRLSMEGSDEVETFVPTSQTMRAWGGVRIPAGSQLKGPFSYTTAWVEMTDSGGLALYSRGPSDPKEGTLLLTFGCRDKLVLGELLRDADALEKTIERVQGEMRSQGWTRDSRGEP